MEFSEPVGVETWIYEQYAFKNGTNVIKLIFKATISSFLEQAKQMLEITFLLSTKFILYQVPKCSDDLRDVNCEQSNCVLKDMSNLCLFIMSYIYVMFYIYLLI